jgi:hypothetical protein
MQQAEVPARSRRTHAQAGGNLAGALRLALQQLHNPAPRRIGQRGKRPIDVGARRRTGPHLGLLRGLRENPPMSLRIDRAVHTRAISIGRLRDQRGAVRTCPGEMRVDVVDRAVGLPVHVGKLKRTPTKPVELLREHDRTVARGELGMANPTIVHSEPIFLNEAECARQKIDGGGGVSIDEIGVPCSGMAISLLILTIVNRIVNYCQVLIPA